MVFLLSCAVCVGLDRPLAAVTEPSLFGSVRTIASLSLFATDQPAGTGIVTPSFDSVCAPEVAGGDPGGGPGSGPGGGAEGGPCIGAAATAEGAVSGVPHDMQ